MQAGKPFPGNKVPCNRLWSKAHYKLMLLQVILLARAIANKIEDTLDYPGQIKVNVIRESRAVEYAK